MKNYDLKNQKTHSKKDYWSLKLKQHKNRFLSLLNISKNTSIAYSLLSWSHRYNIMNIEGRTLNVKKNGLNLARTPECTPNSSDI